MATLSFDVKDAEARVELADVEEYVYGALEPWRPLYDGYSNFWFELTNNTLSPWLNFSAKNNDATIDWGDGSGEQALTTLTPTHTYSKAGRYVVKVKGVTGIARQHNTPYSGEYMQVLRNLELNSEVTTLATSAFTLCSALKNVVLNAVTTADSSTFRYCGSLLSVSILSNLTNLSSQMFQFDFSLENITIPSTVTLIDSSSFYSCFALKRLTIPANVTSIGTYCFYTCNSLSEVHIQATVPPTLGANNFVGMPANWICYVPVGYGETYKSASGWSTYADHILEEGQTPNRMMLAKFNSTKTDEPQDDMR